MSKSPDAFRTISEVAEWLDTPAHVLRFWESRFRQVKPVKRAGGRRYYRPSDMALLGGIKRLLHDDGMTIKGVQKILRDKGAKHVADLSAAIDPDISQTDMDAAEARLMASIAPAEPKETPVIVDDTPVNAPEPVPAKDDVVAADPVEIEDEPTVPDVEETETVAPETTEVEPEDVPAPVATVDDTPAAPEPEPPTDSVAPAEPDLVDAPAPTAQDPVQLDLLAPDEDGDVDVIEPNEPVTEVEPTPPAETAQEDDVAEDKTAAAPKPIVVDVPDDPTDDGIVADGVDETVMTRLIAAEPSDFAGKTEALRALYDRMKGAA